MSSDDRPARQKSTRDKLRALHALAGPYRREDPVDAPTDPTALFLRWLDAAIATGQQEPHAMTLSTVDEDGRPDARVLLLKDVDADGWHFASTKQGVKGRQIAANPNTALTFYWQPLGRQVRIRGAVKDLGLEASRDDFRARSAGARAIALTGQQSNVLASADDVDEAFSRQQARLAADPDLVAPGWTAFVVAAQEVEFWQGHEERRHWRLKYARDTEGWSRTLLWP
jgi:pyridoxamine 5'-phosphate oxidase